MPSLPERASRIDAWPLTKTTISASITTSHGGDFSRGDARARAHDRRCVEYVGLPVKSILDAGCGVGLLKSPLTRAFPGAEYVASNTANTCADATAGAGFRGDLRTRERFDLVVCYDVLQYLARRSAARDREPGARVRGALYFGP